MSQDEVQTELLPAEQATEDTGAEATEAAAEQGETADGEQ